MDYFLMQEQTNVLKKNYSDSFKNSLILKIIFSISFIFLMAVSANTFFYLPFTPVPFTLQTLTVLASAILMGKNAASLTQAGYIAAGLIGFPVFAGFKSSFAVLAGPTAGYLFGFIAGAYISGFIFENLNNKKPGGSFNLIAALGAGITVIYIFGFAGLCMFLHLSSLATGLKSIMALSFDLAVRPFIIFDLIKIFIIVNMAEVITSRYKKCKS